MPELPEVEVVRRGLEAHVLGAAITDVEVLHPRPVRRHLPGPADFAARLTGRRFTAARRRGKYLWLPLDSPDGSRGDAMLAHLGMSGQLLVQPVGVPDERHLRVRFRLAGGFHRAEVRRPADVRRPVLLTRRCGAARGDRPHRPRSARPACSTAPTSCGGCDGVRRASSGLLLDQQLVSGVGNIYADEALWRVRLHGERRGDRLRRVDVEELLAAAREVMTQALGEGGTSFDALYVNVNGQSGYFDRSLNAYGRRVARAHAAAPRSVASPSRTGRPSSAPPVSHPRGREGTTESSPGRTASNGLRGGVVGLC